ncbi:hypothetical protein Nepgr_007468 [Nepenthes gracilis]|uniref:Uncharacterized protein n=1 Tax=Nepenthes gracilis TaxID=150966 RepID=A0AAD3S6Z1_NEPGR|nr:hypothetical protein Nepgr_007468 [Nepenthes gracilis]
MSDQPFAPPTGGNAIAGSPMKWEQSDGTLRQLFLQAFSDQMSSKRSSRPSAMSLSSVAVSLMFCSSYAQFYEFNISMDALSELQETEATVIEEYQWWLV